MNHIQHAHNKNKVNVFFNLRKINENIKQKTLKINYIDM